MSKLFIIILAVGLGASSTLQVTACSKKVKRFLFNWLLCSKKYQQDQSEKRELATMALEGSYDSPEAKLIALNSIIIKLPSAEILKDRLIKAGFAHIVQQTQIHTKLGNQNMIPAKLLTTVCRALVNDSHHYIGQSLFPLMLRILQDSPDIIEKFRNTTCLSLEDSAMLDGLADSRAGKFSTY